MKLLKENQPTQSNFFTYQDLKKELSSSPRNAKNKIMKFLKDPDVRQALDNYDFDKIYQEYLTVEDGRCTEFEIGYFTTLFYKMGKDPLKYLDYVPDNFLAYSTITDITIPNGIKSIGDLAFYECPNLQDIVIPASVTHIGEFAFGYRGAYTSCKPRRIRFKPNSQLTRIGEGAFCHANIRSISLPDRLEYIDDYAFLFGGDFTKIEFPPTVTQVGRDAFAHCDAITTIKINSRIKFRYEVFGGLYRHYRTVYMPKNLWSSEYVDYLENRLDPFTHFHYTFKTF